MNKILHIMSGSSIYNSKFINFLNCFFDNDRHKIVVIGSNNGSYDSNITFINKKKQVFELIELMKNSDKIIIHGLFSYHLFLLLFGQPKLLKKSYWVIWGGDLYYYKFRDKSFKSNIYEFIRRKVIKNIGHIVALVEGDYELAKKWYKTQAVYHEAFYPNTIIFENIDKTNNSIKNNKKIIQIGNSADPRNRHIEILDKLLRFGENDIEIVAPLSYGDRDWAKKVIENGKRLYGDKFRPLERNLPLEEYQKFLDSVDVAIFNHDRQQALGNILALLHLGKKVFIKNDITTWDFLNKKGLTLYNTYDIDKLSFEEFVFMDESLKEKNKKIIEKEFSEEKCVELWKNIFNS